MSSKSSEQTFGVKSLYFLRDCHSVEIRYTRDSWPGGTQVTDIVVDGISIIDEAKPSLLEWAQKEAEEDYS